MRSAYPMTVVAVFELSPLMMTWTGTRWPGEQIFLQPRRNDQHRAHLAAIDQLLRTRGCSTRRPPDRSSRS